MRAGPKLTNKNKNNHNSDVWVFVLSNSPNVLLWPPALVGDDGVRWWGERCQTLIKWEL